MNPPKVNISAPTPWKFASPKPTSTPKMSRVTHTPMKMPKKGTKKPAKLTQTTLTKEMKNNKTFGVGVGP